MTDLIKFDPMEEMPNIIKVVGVGGGGSNAVTHMFTEGIQGVDFILCNTDHQALEKSPVAMKVHLGKRALGAGNMPSVGREAAMETVDELREILSRDTKMVFITAGMGGGTGTGAAPVVASIAKELDILTVGIVTLPFSFEGKRRQQQALDGINELRKHVDTLLVISNDKLRQEHGDMKLTQAFKKADDVLKTAAKGIAEIITVTGYVNVDFQDVNTVMRNSGKAIMGSGYAEGENRARKAVEEAVHSPLLDDSDIRGAKNILIYITSGSDEVSLDEVTEITEYVQDATGNCSEVIWGNGEDISLGKGLNVTLIATGFNDNTIYEEDNYEKKVHDMYNQAAGISATTEEPKIKTPKPEQTEHPTGIHSIDRRNEKHNDSYESNNGNKIIHPLSIDVNENVNFRNNNNNERIIEHHTSSENKKVDNGSTYRVYNPFNNDDDEDFGISSHIKDCSEKQTQTITQTRTQIQNKTQEEQLSHEEILRRQRLTSLNMNFRSMECIEELENQPAYKRRGLNINIDSQDQELSNYSSNKNKGISESNSYLHNNVD